MRNRLLTIIALAVFGAVLAAGAVGAQSVEGGAGSGDVSIDLPGGAAQPDPAQSPACSNLEDDDQDGLVDVKDPGCDSPGDLDETDPAGEKDTDVDAAPDQGEEGDGGNGKGPRVPPVDGPLGKGGKDKKGGKNGGPGNAPDSSPFDQAGEDGKKDNKPVDRGDRDDRDDKAPEIRRPDGAPSNSNPNVTITPSGPAPIGVPNFVIDRFTIPPFLLPIYQACGTQYGIPWQVLASINRIETAFGTNLNVSTAGAVGWMQFIPSTWKAYGVDANGDGRKDPYNPVDAICGAARYLKASGGEKDLGRAIFAYNRADWYVDEVLLYARQYGKLPGTLVDSLTGLTEGARFPVAAKARYADDISERNAQRRAEPQKGSQGNVADVISDSPTRRGIDIFSKEGAPVVAVNDGTIKKIGKNKKLGKFIVLEDAYGNEFVYARLGEIADAVAVPKERKLSADDFKLVSPNRDGELQVNKAIKQRGSVKKLSDAKSERRSSGRKADRSATKNTEDARDRIYARPTRPANRDRADLSGQLDDVMDKGVPGYETFKAYFTGVLEFDSKTMETKPLRKGSKVIAGTPLGEIGGEVDGTASHLNFAIEPAGRGSRKIDPKPILDGWKLLEATAIYRAAGKNPFDDQANVGEILLASKVQLQQMVLKDPRIEVYSCGRDDIKNGIVDRRVLASLSYLAERGFRPTVTSLACGRSSRFTSSGNVSAHPTGDAVDIARLNGLPVLGNQGKGSITEAAVRELLKLQGSMEPAQIITLMELGGPTFAMADHDDHIHLGFQPDTTGKGKNFSLLKPDQWDKLVDRIGSLDQPKVPVKPSKFTIPAKSGKRASDAHLGE